jgi:3-oxoacyl-(acyl-carrier-protein) synthase III
MTNTPVLAPAPTFTPTITGVGVYRPRRLVTNAEICLHIDSSPEWIERRSGIRTRRFAAPDETLAEMGAAAAAKALADAGADPSHVDLLVVATMSQITPPTHPHSLPDAIAARLGLRAATIGVSAACSGFTVALNLAASSIRSGTARSALVIGTERMSDIVSPTDRGTAFLFSDGAGAVLVTRSHTSDPDSHPSSSRIGIGPVVWGSDTRLAEAITLGPIPGSPDSEPKLRMAGNTVFRWAVTQLPSITRRILERSGLTANDISAFIPHQANARITDAVAQAVGFPDSVAIARDVADQGNASAASIPLALDRMRTAGQVQHGDLALLLGFGAGLSYAGMVVTIP